MTLLERMPHQVRIDRFRYETDELGGNIETPVAIASGVEAWVQNAGMNEISEYQKRDERVTHKVFFPTEPPLRVGDRITVTATTAADGVMAGLELKFLARSDRSAGLGVLYAAMCVEENNERPASFQ